MLCARLLITGVDMRRIACFEPAGLFVRYVKRLKKLVLLQELWLR